MCVLNARRRVNSWRRCGIRAALRRHETGVRASEAWAGGVGAYPRSAQGGRQDQDAVRAAFIEAIDLAISRSIVSMPNSRLLYASTRRCVRAQPWGVSPHARRAQRGAGPCRLSHAHQVHSAVLNYVIFGRRLASGLDNHISVRPDQAQAQTPIGVLIRTVRLVRQGHGVGVASKVERRGPTAATGGRGADCDDAERAFIPSSAFPPVSFALPLTVICRDCSRPRLSEAESTTDIADSVAW